MKISVTEEYKEFKHKNTILNEFNRESRCANVI
jgi:hypothetical protein